MTRLLLGALASVALALPAAALEVPYLSGRVVDDARLLDAGAAQALTDALKSYEERTGRQIVVLTIPSLEGAAAEEFAIKTARTWKLGRKGQDDGILVLVARDDHQARIEVGYGLEGTLPDALCGRIIRDEMVPHFRSGDYAGGLQAGVDAIVRTLDGTYSPPPEALPTRSGQKLEDLGLLDKILMSFFIFGVLSLFETAGLAAPGVGWILYFFLIPFWAAFPMALWGANVGLGMLGAHLLGFPILKVIVSRSEWGRQMARSFGARRGRGTVVGSGWRGGGGYYGDGGGWGGGGDGGFSGGGGSFGGGGASGSW